MSACLLIVGLWAVLVALAFGICRSAKDGDRGLGFDVLDSWSDDDRGDGAG